MATRWASFRLQTLRIEIWRRGQLCVQGLRRRSLYSVCSLRVKCTLDDCPNAHRSDLLHMGLNLARLVAGPMFRLLSTWHNHISSNSSSSVKIKLSQHVEGEVAENPIPRRHRASVIFVLMQKYLHASCASYSKLLQTWSVVYIKFSISIWLNYLRFWLNILI